MQNKRTQLKIWLLSNGLSRKDFASKLGISFTTVDGWFSNRNIPDKKWDVIKDFFESNKDRRKQLKEWLAQAGMNRKDFAAQFGVSEASVYNWLSCTNIPDKRWKQIKEFFAKTADEATPEQFRVVGAVFSAEEVEKMKEAANGMALEAYLRQCILRQIKADLSEQ